ncbi:hypothetical protein MPTK1_2g26340 [Marchantia polymorpha subsp. ruderalis]|uniref:Transport and Golgi organization protein 2 homolog n=1 Tax=Marchantia polymorpha TaxID=3197 RepID=A0A2R6XB66_MARPO|nr:hypothetical protein MARPO_0025s0050 [Marchantia polymorpha]BBN03779.1 hypothetical protein Mp_2g26340 [Marchantia polymorpha subsp. ruderalis]|eukprot:PTQ43356.1 hypothetical protein MARPO_0025s0050 [Marchantia polymorpha]
MCISFWALDEHPGFWLVLAVNRDEFHSRPTLALHCWDDDEEEPEGDGPTSSSIVGGRDVSGGGTWLGMTKSGRLAFLTNVREAKFLTGRGTERTDVTSRGALPTLFLRSAKGPADYLEEVARAADDYNGFNLIVADVRRREMAFLSNRPEGAKAVVHLLRPGFHSLSNGGKDSKWWKMERGKRKLEAVLSALSSSSASASAEEGDDLPNELIVEQVLHDRTKPDDVSVQTAETGCTEAMERDVGSIFVDTALFDRAYGTRSMSVIGIRTDGTVSFFERSLEGGVWKDTLLRFPLEDCA